MEARAVSKLLRILFVKLISFCLHVLVHIRSYLFIYPTKREKFLKKYNAVMEQSFIENIADEKHI